jgi:hypothetical protein
MNNTIKLAVAMLLAGGLSQASFADESSSSVTESQSNGAQASTSKVKASTGPDGAKISRTKTDVSANPDGSVSATKQHESHAMGTNGGEAHHKSSSATTVGPDGSTSSASTSQHTTKP